MADELLILCFEVENQAVIKAEGSTLEFYNANDAHLPVCVCARVHARCVRVYVHDRTHAHPGYVGGGRHFAF